VGARTSYPTLFRQTPRALGVRPGSQTVTVRRGAANEPRQTVTASLVVSPGAPVELRVLSADAQQLRLHSAHTGVETGELRWLFGSEPALLLRPATGELTISFTSRDDRDAVFAALAADVEHS